MNYRYKSFRCSARFCLCCVTGRVDRREPLSKSSRDCCLSSASPDMNYRCKAFPYSSRFCRLDAVDRRSARLQCIEIRESGRFQKGTSAEREKLEIFLVEH